MGACGLTRRRPDRDGGRAAPQLDSDRLGTSTIIGARNVERLQANLASVELTLTPDDLQAIEAVSKRPVLYPDWMVGFQAGDRK